MKKTILAAVPLALLALAVPQAAQAKRATSYKAKLAPAAGSAVRGQAKLVDGARRDRVRLRVRGLEAGASYSWSLRRASAGGDACTGRTVSAFGSGELTGRRGGRARARSHARGFSGGDAAFAVVIEAEDGEPVACLRLKSKAQRKADRERAEEEEAFEDDDDLLDEDEEDADDVGGEDLDEDEPAEDEEPEDELLDDAV